MTSKTAKWIFYGGTLSSAALFLALTVDMHRQVGALTNADRLDDQVVAGKRVWQKYNCNDCHTILGFGGYYSPDLTRVYSRRGEAYIREVLAHPAELLKDSFRKMPQRNLSDLEIAQLVAFFRWVNDIDTHDWPPQDSRKRRAMNRQVSSTMMTPGAAAFKENDCFACHKLGGAGGTEGPALDDVGSRLDMDAIARLIANPQSVNPDAIMPAYPDLPPEEVLAMAEFLSKQGQRDQGGVQ